MVYKSNEGFYISDAQNPQSYCDAQGNPVQVPVTVPEQSTESAPKQSNLNPQIEVDNKAYIKITQEELDEKIQSSVSESVKAVMAEINLGGGMGTSDVKALTKSIKDAMRSNANDDIRVWGSPPISEEEIPVDDFLEEPVVFYAYVHTTTVFDDFRKNQAVRTPYGRPIRFSHLYRTRKQVVPGKKNGQVIAMSSATIYSKKEAEWMRNHSKYRLMFFESVAEAQMVNSIFAEKLKDVDKEVGDNEFQIIDRAAKEGLALKTDITQLRTELIYRLAQRRVEEESNRLTIPIQDFSKESVQPQKEVIDNSPY